MALPEQMRELAVTLARTIQSVVPARFRGVIRISVDNGVVHAHDVAIEFRPPQPKVGSKGE